MRILLFDSSVAVPERAIAHAGTLGATPVAVAVHVSVVPLNVPLADPDT
jgi:hypothetical protein